MTGIVHDSLGGVSHAVIGGATGTALATPDHTTQILAIVVQLITLALAIFGRKNTQNNIKSVVEDNQN